jgi:hypothetical protein
MTIMLIVILTKVKDAFVPKPGNIGRDDELVSFFFFLFCLVICGLLKVWVGGERV